MLGQEQSVSQSVSQLFSQSVSEMLVRCWWHGTPGQAGTQFTSTSYLCLCSANHQTEYKKYIFMFNCTDRTVLICTPVEDVVWPLTIKQTKRAPSRPHTAVKLPETETKKPSLHQSLGICLQLTAYIFARFDSRPRARQTQ